MAKYQYAEIVDAEPMTSTEYYKTIHCVFYGDCQSGYRVITSGVSEWWPKEEFEKSFKLIKELK
jgi:hypothetical protein